MNKATRKVLSGLMADAEKITSMIEDLKSQLETIRDEEQGKFDNMPEGLQEGDKGEAMTSAIEAIEAAIEKCDGFDDIASDLDNAMA